MISLSSLTIGWTLAVFSGGFCLAFFFFTYNVRSSSLFRGYWKVINKINTPKPSPPHGTPGLRGLEPVLFQCWEKLVGPYGHLGQKSASMSSLQNANHRRRPTTNYATHLPPHYHYHHTTTTTTSRQKTAIQRTATTTTNNKQTNVTIGGLPQIATLSAEKLPIVPCNLSAKTCPPCIAALVKKNCPGSE